LTNLGAAPVLESHHDTHTHTHTEREEEGENREHSVWFC